MHAANICTDSDNGIHAVEAGVTDDGSGEKQDTCKNADWLSEYYCDAKTGKARIYDILCLYGCNQETGVCFRTPQITEEQSDGDPGATHTYGPVPIDDPSHSPTATSAGCTENDGGIHAVVAGTTRQGTSEESDTCVDDQWLEEYYCDRNTAQMSSMKLLCLYGCDAETNACRTTTPDPGGININTLNPIDNPNEETDPDPTEDPTPPPPAPPAPPPSPVPVAPPPASPAPPTPPAPTGSITVLQPSAASGWGQDDEEIIWRTNGINTSQSRFSVDVSNDNGTSWYSIANVNGQPSIDQRLKVRVLSRREECFTLPRSANITPDRCPQAQYYPLLLVYPIVNPSVNVSTTKAIRLSQHNMKVRVREITSGLPTEDTNGHQWSGGLASGVEGLSQTFSLTETLTQTCSNQFTCRDAWAHVGKFHNLGAAYQAIQASNGDIYALDYSGLKRIDMQNKTATTVSKIGSHVGPAFLTDTHAYELTMIGIPREDPKTEPNYEFWVYEFNFATGTEVRHTIPALSNLLDKQFLRQEWEKAKAFYNPATQTATVYGSMKNVYFHVGNRTMEQTSAVSSDSYHIYDPQTQLVRPFSKTWNGVPLRGAGYDPATKKFYLFERDNRGVIEVNGTQERRLKTHHTSNPFRSELATFYDRNTQEFFTIHEGSIARFNGSACNDCRNVFPERETAPGEPNGAQDRCWDRLALTEELQRPSAVVQFGSRLWMYKQSDVEDAPMSAYSSLDGIQWRRETTDLPSVRGTMVEHNGQLWYFFGEFGRNSNEWNVWVSDDARNWKGYRKRTVDQWWGRLYDAVSHNGNLYLFTVGSRTAGVIRVGEFEEETNHVRIHREALISLSGYPSFVKAVSHQGKLWMLGRRLNLGARPTEPSWYDGGDIYSSADGKGWTKEAQNVHHNGNPVVFNGLIHRLGGINGQKYTTAGGKYVNTIKPQMTVAQSSNGRTWSETDKPLPFAVDNVTPIVWQDQIWGFADDLLLRSDLGACNKSAGKIATEVVEPGVGHEPPNSDEPNPLRACVSDAWVQPEIEASPFANGRITTTMQNNSILIANNIRDPKGDKIYGLTDKGWEVVQVLPREPGHTGGYAILGKKEGKTVAVQVNLYPHLTGNATWDNQAKLRLYDQWAKTVPAVVLYEWNGLGFAITRKLTWRQAGLDHRYGDLRTIYPALQRSTSSRVAWFDSLHQVGTFMTPAEQNILYSFDGGATAHLSYGPTLSCRKADPSIPDDVSGVQGSLPIGH